jgi:HEAT repeat protein
VWLWCLKDRGMQVPANAGIEMALYLPIGERGFLLRSVSTNGISQSMLVERAKHRAAPVRAIVRSSGAIAIACALLLPGPGLAATPEEVERIAADLASRRSAEQIEAAKQLAGLGKEGSAAVPALIAALEDKDPQVRREVVLALGRMGDRRALDDLARVLSDDREAPVRDVAVNAVAAIDDPRAGGCLVRALSDDDCVVRASAAFELGNRADASAFGALVAALSDECQHVRRHAALALGVLRDERALPHVAPLLDDRDEKVRDAAAGALSHITGVALPDTQAWRAWLKAR